MHNATNCALQHNPRAICTAYATDRFHRRSRSCRFFGWASSQTRATPRALTSRTPPYSRYGHRPAEGSGAPPHTRRGRPDQCPPALDKSNCSVVMFPVSDSWRYSRWALTCPCRGCSDSLHCRDSGRRKIRQPAPGNFSMESCDVTAQLALRSHRPHNTRNCWTIHTRNSF